MFIETNKAVKRDFAPQVCPENPNMAKSLRPLAGTELKLHTRLSFVAI